MKKLIMVGVALCLMISLVACGEGPSGDSEQILKVKNCSEYIQFLEIANNSVATKDEKKIDYEFSVRAKDGFDLSDDFAVVVKPTVFYRCGDADIQAHQMDEFELTKNHPQGHIIWEDNRIIDYLGTIVESVKYDIVSISGSVVEETETEAVSE